MAWTRWREQTFYKVPTVLVWRQKHGEYAKLSLDFMPLHPALGISAVVWHSRVSKDRLPDVPTVLFHLPCDLLRWLSFISLPFPVFFFFLFHYSRLYFVTETLLRRRIFRRASGWFLRGSKPTSLGTKRIFVLLKTCYIYFQRHSGVKGYDAWLAQASADLGVCKSLKHKYLKL